MKRAAFVFVAVLLCLAPAAVLAAAPPNAFTLKVGAYFPQSDLDDLDFDTGFNAEVSYTLYVHPNIALEVGLGYFKTKSDPIDSEVTTYPITFNVKGVFPIGGVELYGLAGLGAYYSKFEINGIGDENDTVLGWQLGAGANFNITPVFFVGAEAKYIWAKPDFGTIGPIFVGEIAIDGLQLTGNLGYRF